MLNTNPKSRYPTFLKTREKDAAKTNYFLRMLHWSTLGQIRHSSWVSVLPGGAFSSPLKWAHLAGESKTVGYSVALTSIIFILSVIISRRDMQNGHA